MRAHVRDARRAAARADVARRRALVFTAHSIPTVDGRARRDTGSSSTSRRGSSRATAGMRDWALVYQSRSGRPEDPWLEPDVCDYLRREHAAGLAAAVLCPIGFVCDHIEVLYDLDREAADVCREIGLPMARAEAVNDDPLFLDMMADVVMKTIRRYEQEGRCPFRPAKAGHYSDSASISPFCRRPDVGARGRAERRRCRRASRRVCRRASIASHTSRSRSSSSRYSSGAPLLAQSTASWAAWSRFASVSQAAERISGLTTTRCG